MFVKRTWEDFVEMLRLVLDYYGIKYEEYPSTCGDDYRECGRFFTFRTNVASIQTRSVSGDVSGDLAVRVLVTNNEYGVPIFRVLELGHLHIKIPFTSIFMQRDSFGFEGFEGMVEINAPKEDLIENVLLHLTAKLDDRIESRKKLMKLMFLVNYIDPDTDELLPEPRLGTDFYLYENGFFNVDVLSRIEVLEKNKVIDYEKGFDPFYKDKLPKIPEDLEKVIDHVVRMYGDMSGEELTKYTIKMAGLDPEDRNSIEMNKGFALSELLER